MKVRKDGYEARPVVGILRVKAERLERPFF
jgi:hypothetical protein